MITERMQKRLLYQAFVAQEIDSDEIALDGWRSPWRDILLAAESKYVMGDDLYGRLAQGVKLVANDDELAQRWIGEIEDSKNPLKFESLAELTLPPVSWLWQDWIPRGMISLLGAYQGTGKSYFVLDLARTVIHGGQWPDGKPVEKTGTVIYVEAESIPQVTNERATALGMDKRKIWLLMAENGELLDLTKPAWQDKLIDMTTTLRPELIVIDSLTSISSAGQNSVEDTNRLLMFLVALARYADCGMLVLHHLRKPPGGQLALPGMSIHDFRGSGHITAMGRSIMGLSIGQSGRQFSLNGPRRLDLVKTNLCKYPETGIGLTLEEGDGTARFVYGVAEAFDAQESPGESCEDWMLDYLALNGASKPADVLEAGEQEGYTRATMYRTRKALRAQIRDTEKNFRNPSNRWALREDEDEGEDDDADERLAA